MGDPPRRRQARTSARRLHEADPAVAHLGLGLEVGQAEGGEGDVPQAHTDAGDADVAAARVAEAHDPAAPVAVVLDLDVGAELVGEAEAVRHPQRLEVLDDVGGRFVVMEDAHLERHLCQAGDRFGRDPRHGCD